jgi:hypothetical protein
MLSQFVMLDLSYPKTRTLNPMTTLKSYWFPTYPQPNSHLYYEINDNDRDVVSILDVAS